MRYRIVETAQFRNLWQSAIITGVVNSVAESLLQGLTNLLSLEPYYFPLFQTYGESTGLRWVSLIQASSVRVEIWYSVVEDDLVVYLESVEIIRPPQQILT